MDILKKLDKITEHITELESIKEAAKDFVKHWRYDENGKRLIINVADMQLADSDLQHLRSLLLKGKE